MSTKAKAATLTAALVLGSAVMAGPAAAHSIPYCGHGSRTVGDHRVDFLRHDDGQNVWRTEHVRWTGTGYTVTNSFTDRTVCRHHL
jgi:hypothetical protein